jgi:Gas vesicle synthesis protein GvpO
MSEEDDGSTNNRMSARDLALEARATVKDMTGFNPETVSGLQWDGETWLVTVDVCELERIPSTTDVIATYVVQLDDGGGLLGYKRTRRYQRGQAEEC